MNIFFRTNFAPDFTMSENEISTFNTNTKYGESLAVTVFNMKGNEDNIIAAIQFKRSPKGVWINYMGTSSLAVTGPIHGTAEDFLPIGSSFRKLGLGLMLLRAVQLYQVCTGGLPYLFVQVKEGSELAKYLLNRGFVSTSIVDIVDENGNVSSSGNNEAVAYSELCTQDATVREGTLYRDENGYIILGLLDVAIQDTFSNRTWKHPELNTWTFVPDPKSSDTLLKSTWPSSDLLFQFPFRTDANYVDQAGKGLLLLGCPFFNCRNPNQLNGNRTFQMVHIDGGKYNNIYHNIIGRSTEWLASEHI